MNYLAECIRLLYWTYFKPYTLKNWLRDIHPELKLDSNPLNLQEEFAHNPRLRRYASQVWWLKAIIPSLIVLLLAPICSLIVEEPFNWLYSQIFFLAWWGGLVIARVGARLISKNPHILTILTTLLLGILVLLGDMVGYLMVAVAVAGGIALGMMVVSGGISVGFCVGFFVWISMTIGMGEGMMESLAGIAMYGMIMGLWMDSMISSIERIGEGMVPSAGLIGFRLLLGGGLGVWMGISEGVWAGVASGVACVLVVLRVYLWLPELLWMLLLFFFLPQRRFPFYLGYLPPYFDQIIYLPLPFLSKFIVAAYRGYPTVPRLDYLITSRTRQTLDYLITSTNQQAAASRAIVDIANAAFS